MQRSCWTYQWLAHLRVMQKCSSSHMMQTIVQWIDWLAG